MSNRDSMGFGDLLPQDVVEVFAQEKHSKRGRKKRRRTLGRAFSWLKGKRRKNLGANGQGLGLGPALNLELDGRPARHQGGFKGGQKSGRQAHPQGNSHAVPKRDDDDKTPAPPRLQENVFIESSRPKYLEDLHTEALEGLKMMQQEETNNGVEYRDNESTISSVTVQTDGEGGGFVTDSTIPDSSSVVSMQSSVSTRSSRSGLTRQGSTFRPLNSGKKSKKARTGRRHRKTVVGIPKHVQKELGLDRAAWARTQRLDEEQFYNGESDTSHTSDGPQYAAESAKEAGASLQATNIIMPLSKDKLKLLGATHAGHRDDLALLHRLGPHLEGGQRPRSLAVPWMTTASSFQQQPPSPVMSMSPQAAYLSKIIPNAVLPPSIEVVEISRGRSRSSVRTVSKSSLVLSSPAPSRASSRASSSRTISSNITSVSRYNIPNVSDSSCWSNSDSSETLVSDSSTISSSSTPRQRMSQDQDASAKQGKVINNSSNFTTNGTSNGKLIIKEDKVEKDGQFVRSLSVIKPKRAPPPPSRSYSLHNRMKRRSRDLAEARISPGESSLHSTSAPSEENEKNKLASSPMPSIRVDSPGYHADTSSLEDSTASVSFSLMKSQLQEPKREDVKNNAETVSKEASHEKQEPFQENKLNKVVSPSSGYSSQDGTSPQVSKQPHSSSPKHKKGFLAKLHMLFHGSTSVPSPQTKPEICGKTEITAGPKSDLVDSVSPSVRTLRELFNIPPPPKVHAPPPPPPEVWAHNKRTFELLLGPPAPDNTQEIIKKNPKDRRQQRLPPSVSTEGSVKSLEVERKHKNPTVTVDTVNGSLNVPVLMKVQESRTLNGEIHKENTGRLAQNGDLKGNDKDEKVRVCDMLNGMLVKTVEKREETLAAKRIEEGQSTSTVPTVVNTKIETSPVASLVRISPSPSSTLANHPSQPLTRLTTEAASGTSVQVVSPESSWPPPPPPMGQVGTNGPDDIDLPLPPPPMFGEEVLVLPVQVPPKHSVLGSDLSCATVSVKHGGGAESVKVITGAEPQKRRISQEMAPTNLNIPPPPPYTAPLAPKTAVVAPTTEKVSLPLKEVSPPPPPLKPKQSTILVHQEVPPLVTVVSPSPVTEVTPPLVVEVSPLPCEEASQSAEEAAPESKLMPPQSIPPPPPLPSQLHPSEQIDPPQENIPLEPESNMDSSNSILTPPQSIPPTPPIEPLLQRSERSQTTDYPATFEAPPSPPSEFRNSPLLKDAEEPASLPPISVPLPPPFPVQGHASIKHQSSSLSTENQNQEMISAPVEPAPSITPSLLHVVTLQSVDSNPEPPQAQEQTSAPVAHEEPTPVAHEEPTPVAHEEPTPVAHEEPTPVAHEEPTPVAHEEPTPVANEEPTPVANEEPTPVFTPSLLQMVKLRSVNSSPEPPESQQQLEPEVTMNQQQPSNQVPTSSYSSEAPQKPIRRSLIMISPTPASPSVVDTSQPTLPKSPSVVVSPEFSSTSVSPVKKSPPTMTISPSMNLQEAIRLRTAARSKEGSASHLSLHSPSFPKSPTSTANFIFSKSNNKVVIETKHVMEDKETKQKNIEVSPETKTIGEAESTKTRAKVPPAVAKKPKTKCKGTETSEGVVQTEGQEAEQESIRDAAEETSGTAGTVEGATSST